MGSKQVQQSKNYDEKPTLPEAGAKYKQDFWNQQGLLAANRAKTKNPEDAFYGMGSKQVQQSKNYDEKPTLPEAGAKYKQDFWNQQGLLAAIRAKTKNPEDPFYGMGSKQVQQSKNYDEKPT